MRYDARNRRCFATCGAQPLVFLTFHKPSVYLLGFVLRGPTGLERFEQVGGRRSERRLSDTTPSQALRLSTAPALHWRDTDCCLS